MYNVTLLCIRIAIVALEKHEVLHILSVCLYFYISYLVCKAYAIHYIVTCGLSGCTVFFHSIS